MNQFLNILSALILLSSFSALSADVNFYPVCKRTEAVRIELEAHTHKKCHQITVEDMIRVKALNLAGGSIQRLNPWDFQNLPNLKILNLFGNQISSLPPGIFFNLVNLESLDLYRNQISSLPPRIFQNLKGLRVLYLSENQI